MKQVVNVTQVKRQQKIKKSLKLNDAPVLVCCLITKEDDSDIDKCHEILVNLKERKLLNKKHKDYPLFMAEVDEAVKWHEAISDELESKYKQPISQDDGWKLAREMNPYNKQFNAKIMTIMDKYSYLYIAVPKE